MRLGSNWFWAGPGSPRVLRGVLPALFRQMHFVENIRKLSFEDTRVDINMLHPLVTKLDCTIRLTTIRLSITDKGDALLINLILSPAPLEYAKSRVGWGDTYTHRSCGMPP